MPVSDEALESFLGQWSEAAWEQAQAMTKIAARCDETAENDKERIYKLNLVLVALLASVLAAVGLARSVGVL